MKIAVNTRLLLKNRLEGIGQFTNETLSRITKKHPEHQFHFIFDRKYDDSFIYSDNVIPEVAFPQARHPYLWYLFFEYGIPLKLRKIKPDIFLSTDGWIPTDLDIPVVNVIHDLNVFHNSMFVPKTELNYYKRFFPKFAKNSTRLATVSQFSKNDIATMFDIDKEKIDVVYSGNNVKYKPLEKKLQVEVKKKYTNGCEYFLFVGLIHKRKNLDNIFKAFDNFKEKNGGNVKFVVVGSKKWWKGDIEDTYNAMKHKDDVIMLGFQPTETVIELTASALAVVYTSLFEGFGLPIVDAFNAQVPIITSNITSMPEIAGDAALLVNPYSPEEISAAMTDIYQNENLRNDLIIKGIKRKDTFTWDKTSELLWQTIEKAAAL